MLNDNVTIDLNYKDRENGQIVRLESIINNDFSVILGSPGSGKTLPLKVYEKSNPKVQYFKIAAGIENLLLDDNCYKFLALLNRYLKKPIKIVLTCREAEWTKELEEGFKENHKILIIYTIEPLSDLQQKELAFKYGIEDSFIETVDNKFLANPQMFSMILELWKNNRKGIENKQTLFKQFISLASDEYNDLYKNYMLKEEDKLYRYLGYLAFFYIFSDMREFNDTSLKIIACDSYEREIIDKVIKTKLFSDKTFIHRSIAEFILAKFILKALDSDKLNFRRMQSYFIKDNVAIPKLKGTYAWIRTLSTRYDFKKINAYEELIYGDVSKLQERKDFILQIKEESEKNPYFRYNLRNETSDIDVFSQEKALYSAEIENFLVDEFDKTKDLNNNYPMFITTILTKGETATKKYIKSSIKSNSISEHFITCFMTLFKNDKANLDFILNEVSSGNITDKNNHIREQYLSLLYSKLTGDEIGEIISSYNYTDSYITIYFIEFEKLDISKQEEIITSLGQNITISNRHIDNNIEKLIERFLVNTILAYCDNQISNEKAYQTFKKVRELFYKDDNRLANINIPIYIFSVQQKGVVKNLFEFFFERYVEDILSLSPDEYRRYFFNFDNCFFYNENIDKLKIFLLTVDKEYSESIKKELLIDTLPYSIDDKVDEIVSKAEEHNLKDWLEEVIKEGKQISEKYKLKQKQQSDGWALAERKEIDGFIDYISVKSDDDLYENLHFMHHITNLFLFEKNKLEKLSFDVKSRLNNLLQNFIHTKSASNLTVESIIKEDFLGKRRYISNICFVSTYLNEDNLSEIPEDIKKYLYINALRHKYYKISTDSFLEYIENDVEFAIKTLNKTVDIIIDEYFPEIKSFFGKYLDKDNIEDLKLFVGISADNKESLQNELAKQFLYKYANKLLCVREQDLSEFINISNLKEAKAIEKLIKNAEVNFDLDDACYLKEILMKNKELFQHIDKITLVSFIMKQFVSEKDFDIKNGPIGKKNDLLWFLNNNLLLCLFYTELSKLLELPYIDKDIWGNRIYQRIQEEKQTSFKNHKYEVKVVKDLILENKVVDHRDFFEETCYRLENLKNEIESNRNNDKLDFYNEPKNQSKKLYSPKDEDRCRDVILRRLSDKYSDISCIPEKLEADNRADLNIKYKSNIKYEVQIECKKDNHPKLYGSVNNQLIKQYLENKVEYGVYLVFYFGKNSRNEQDMLNKLENDIQESYKNKIKVICIDLTGYS